MCKRITYKFFARCWGMTLKDLMPGIFELIPYEYDQIRTPEYDRIIAGFQSRAKKSPSPRFIQIGGIPGAGKTTFCQSSNWEQGLFISFDAIMEMLLGYQQDLYTLGPAAAFNKWEIPARVIGYELLRLSVENKYDICLEHSGVNTPHIQLMNNLKKRGYSTEMYFILCRPDLAYKRAVEREKQTRRHTSKEMIDKRYSLVQTYLPQYKKIADKMYIYDTSDNQFKLQII